MGDPPKWAAEPLAQLPVAVALFVAMSLTAWWMDRRDAERRAADRAHYDEELRLTKKDYESKLRAKQSRIRELEQSLRDSEGKR